MIIGFTESIFGEMIQYTTVEVMLTLHSAGQLDASLFFGL